jgi:parvulin-like peptidyl-prolyl isomerase
LKKRWLTFFSLIAAALAMSGGPEFSACGQQAPQPSTAGAAAGQRVVLSIGEEKITAAEIEEFIRTLPPQYQAFYGGAGKYLLPQYIIARKVLSAEALKLKLDQQPAVTRALETAREGVLADAARRHFLQSTVASEPELRELYQRDKRLSEEIRIGHILIRTENAPLKQDAPSQPALPEAEAQKKLEDIRKRILAGTDFAQMAKQYSEDTATAASGGDMGVLQRDKVVPPIVNAADSLEPGQVSEIMRTPSGLEIIKVESKRTKSFEEAKPTLETALRESKYAELVERMMKNYHTFIDQEFFAAPSAKQASPPAPAH